MLGDRKKQRKLLSSLVHLARFEPKQANSNHLPTTPTRRHNSTHQQNKGHEKKRSSRHEDFSVYFSCYRRILFSISAGGRSRGRCCRQGGSCRGKKAELQCVSFVLSSTSISSSLIYQFVCFDYFFFLIFRSTKMATIVNKNAPARMCLFAAPAFKRRQPMIIRKMCFLKKML